jgi:hypothetical protein
LAIKPAIFCAASCKLSMGMTDQYRRAGQAGSS